MCYEWINNGHNNFEVAKCEKLIDEKLRIMVKFIKKIYVLGEEYGYYN